MNKTEKKAQYWLNICLSVKYIVEKSNKFINSIITLLIKIISIPKGQKILNIALNNQMNGNPWDVYEKKLPDWAISVAIFKYL